LERILGYTGGPAVILYESKYWYGNLKKMQYLYL
jgi:hypothetical protein